ncbi:hypothetical protein ACFQH6_13885 [Halobacteriaceae archaeon GCM10025711]
MQAITTLVCPLCEHEYEEERKLRRHLMKRHLKSDIVAALIDEDGPSTRGY